jgi:2-phospho-L-lactate guanylyltransferase
MMESPAFSWTVLLPVKVLARAKSRLAVLAGSRRCDLALALAMDTVSAVVNCPDAARVIVITADQQAGPRLAALGAHIVTDVTADTANLAADLDGPGAAPGLDALAALDESGSQAALNAALMHGAAEAARRWPGTGLAALTADLPSLRPAELSTALRAAAASAATSTSRAAFVPDAAGVGTTLYAVTPGGEFRPGFGGRSRARHAAAGAVELALDNVPGLRRDVDTEQDLRMAIALGAGHRTAALAAELLPPPELDQLDMHHRAGQRAGDTRHRLDLRLHELAEFVHVLGACAHDDVIRAGHILRLRDPGDRCNLPCHVGGFADLCLDEDVCLHHSVLLEAA